MTVYENPPSVCRSQNEEIMACRSLPESAGVTAGVKSVICLRRLPESSPESLPESNFGRDKYFGKLRPDSSCGCRS